MNGEDPNSECKLLVNLVRANIYGGGDVPFTWICNAKFLSVEVDEHQEVNTFHNLTNMELIIESWPTKWMWLVELLEHCPKLQNLTLHKLYESEIDELVWKEPQIVPECISSQLRTCSLIDYKGTECELQFAKYILKNAKLMHTMTISASPVVDINTKHQMLMKLSLCPRGSTTCTLSFDS
ncbi:hypothetical protein TSUD_173500 [Trifolium subterraneum]|nr:hypothetical protein TSUD_173500 [Trifolium subterraneum]